MSAIFNSTTDRIATGFTCGVEGTILWAVKPTWVQADNVDHMFWNSVFDGSNSMMALHYGADNSNDLYIGGVIGGVDYRIHVASAGYTQVANAWNFYGYGWKNADSTALLTLGGASIGTRSDIVMGSITGLTLGNTVSGGTDTNMAGKLGRVLCYNTKLSLAKHADFAAGLIPTGYISRYDFNANYNDFNGTNNGTNSNTTLDSADNPRLAFAGLPGLGLGLGVGI